MFSCPEGEGNTKKWKPVRIREETRHYTSTLQPHYQTQFSLFTMPECPMAKADFFYFCADVKKKTNPKTNQFSSSASSWQSVAMDIHVWRSKWQHGGKGKSKAHNSKQLLLPLRFSLVTLEIYIFSHMLNEDRERGLFFFFLELRNGPGKRQISEVRLTPTPISSFSLSH